MTEPASPDVADVQQAEPWGGVFPFPEVPVRVDRIVDVRQVPSRRMVVYTMPLSSGSADRVLNDDPKRSTATLVADEDIMIGSTLTGTYGRWPASVPLVVTAAGELYARAASNDTELTVVVEVWAD